MKAEKHLESIGLSNLIDEEFFNVYDGSWYKVQELMESYHQAKLDLLTIPNVSNMLTVKEVLDILDDSDHLDDAKTLIRGTVS